ncbi:hypothetical protein BDN70DRAFT_908722 [Pholiota conissans]|uniref:Uncharacterized protein n=1 Tax=Pholiota conissans TaxID=109636 RepID=A0A9P5YUA3_9AGAR|nr:hypothetical protein BDN70DRAFT_908722 [Pholiota conissans]
MATPASSATSPSPPMAYRTNVPAAPQQPQAGPSTDPDGVEQRQKAVQKFLARAEISMVTRALRARLAYASYKATHNIPHVPLPELEAQSQSQTASFNRTIAAKRRAVGAAATAPAGYYNNPATQGPSAPGPSVGGSRRGGSGNMAPPASVSSPRMHAPSSSTSYAHYGDFTSGLRNTTQAPTLYTSILAPPPTKQARTIHNPSDPPVPAPERPAPSPRVRHVKASPKGESSRSQANKAKAAAKASKAAASPRRTKGGSIDKGKRRQHHPDDAPTVDIDGDVDMKAAATLTSLLLHNRPSIAGSTSSPRSSIDGGSEAGSAYSYAHFAQSSARTNAPGQGHVSTVSTSTSNLSSEAPITRIQTPPPGVGGPRLQTTPRPAPTDSEAANLMLFLATSPSPARPQHKDAKDMAAYRALSGGTGPLRSKGRVLFPSGDLSAQYPSGPDDAGSSYRTSGSSLARGAEGSFGSSMSSVSSIGLGPELGASAARTQPSGGMLPSSAASVSSTAGNNGVAQLLPPAPLPLPSAPSSPSRNAGASVVKESGGAALPKPPAGVGGTPLPPDMNYHEYAHSQLRIPTGPPLGHVKSSSIGSNGGHKANLGLRADVGRKLFEEEQMRHQNANAHALQLAAAAAAATSSVGNGAPNTAAAANPSSVVHRSDERTLGAGIDLIHSRS